MDIRIIPVIANALNVAHDSCGVTPRFLRNLAQ
jgi:hypothetical protein